MNLLLFEEENLIQSGEARISGERAWHLRSVLRVKPGQRLRVGLVNRGIGTGEVIDVAPEHVLVRFDELRDSAPQTRHIEVILALPRPQMLKRVLETVASMGVTALRLVGSQRVEKSYFQSPLLEEVNYRRYLLKGLEQGMNTRLPHVTIQRHFKMLDFNRETNKLIADPSSAAMVSKKLFTCDDTLQVAIGPEGGWLDTEREYFESRGFTAVSLGHAVLRVDTAVAVSLGQLELIGNQLNER